jgi:hypothetical protein
MWPVGSTRRHFDEGAHRQSVTWNQGIVRQRYETGRDDQCQYDSEDRNQHHRPSVPVAFAGIGVFTGR